MRRSLTVLALFAVALLVAACASSEAPGWTYAAPTSPPPSQPAASGSAAPASVSPGPASEQPSSGGGAGEAVQISALNTAFEQKDVTAPANQDFTIHFDNKDSNVHNVEIKDAGGAAVFKGDLVTGPAATDYKVKALAPGTYSFVCTVHPSMTGTLTAS